MARSTNTPGTRMLRRRALAVTAASVAVLLGATISASPATASSGPGRSAEPAEVPSGPSRSAAQATAATGLSWSVMRTPNPTAPQAALAAVSCSSPKSCMAVGNYYNGNGVQLSLAEAWSGRTWTVEPTPDPARTGEVQLLGISCTSPDACTAVGFSQQGQKQRDQLTLAEVWNGSTWRIEPSPNPAGSPATRLTAVSCTSSTACTAVGWQSIGNFEAPLAEIWDGQAWAIYKTPMAAGSSAGQLLGVSCTSSAACTAVGWQSAPSLVTLAEVWDGSSWSMQPTPNAMGQPGAQGSSLSAVSCISGSTRCTAVGYSNSAEGHQETLAESRDGGTWKVQPTPTPTGVQGIVQGFLTGVSCTSATACSAAGDHFGDAGSQVPLMESWNGTRWEIRPAPGARDSTTVAGISCPAAQECMSAGVDYYLDRYAAPGNGDSFTLVDAWNGSTWSIRPTPNLSGLLYNSLSGVSCGSSTACVGVGYYERADGSSVFFSETWNGAHWTIRPVPVPATATFSRLTAVSCASATYCVAVGRYQTTSSPGMSSVSLIWNGSRWTMTPVAVPGGASTTLLSAVSCTSSTFCTAAGWDEASGAGVTLVETWNGAHWSIQASPNPDNSIGSELTALSCASSTSCSAVGIYVEYQTPYLAFAEAWDGSTWTVQSTPEASGTDTYLEGISCPSPGACTAVGYTGAGLNTLVEVLDAGTWSVVNAPNPGQGGSLFSVSCPSTTFCSAVGDYETISGNYTVTLAEAWDGSGWVVKPTHTKGVRVYQATELTGVSCVSSALCIAGGWNDRSYVTQAGALRAVAERYS